MAPGISPKTSSKVRFSLTISTTCLTPAGRGRSASGRGRKPLASITKAVLAARSLAAGTGKTETGLCRAGGGALGWGARREAVGIHHEGRLGRQITGGGHRENGNGAVPRRQ